MDESCAQEYELRFFFGYFQSTVRPVRAKARHAKQRARTHSKKKREDEFYCRRRLENDFPRAVAVCDDEEDDDALHLERR